MSNPARPRFQNAGWVLIAAATVSSLMLFGPEITQAVARANPHGPDMALFAAQPAAIKAHMLAALCTVGLGLFLLAAPKGRTLHRVAGWTWVVLMGVAALTSLFIVGLNGNSWSVIHILSAVTLVTLPLGVRAARRHDVGAHRRTMTSLFWGASIAAGVFTFLPGRLMWRLFFG